MWWTAGLVGLVLVLGVAAISIRALYSVFYSQPKSLPSSTLHELRNALQPVAEHRSSNPTGEFYEYHFLAGPFSGDVAQQCRDRLSAHLPHYRFAQSGPLFYAVNAGMDLTVARATREEFPASWQARPTSLAGYCVVHALP
jgi:hypothetical protein